MNHAAPRRHPLVRPFAMAAGRTVSSLPLLLHTRILPSHAGSIKEAGASPEARALYGRIHDVGGQTVAELSAACDVPLGVTRVLLGDLAEKGLVAIERETDPYSRSLLEEVLSGLQARL